MIAICVHLKPSGLEAWINGSMVVALWVQGGDTKLLMQGMSVSDAFTIEESPGDIKQAILEWTSPDA